MRDRPATTHRTLPDALAARLAPCPPSPYEHVEKYWKMEKPLLPYPLPPHYFHVSPSAIPGRGLWRDKLPSPHVATNAVEVIRSPAAESLRSLGAEHVEGMTGRLPFRDLEALVVRAAQNQNTGRSLSSCVVVY